MTSGIGNPDWQRRYVSSAVPLLGLNYLDSGSSVSAVSDANGYQYLLVSTNSGSSQSYMHVLVNWYQDSGGTAYMGSTDWVIPPASFHVVKAPVITRYYTIELDNVGGTTGQTINVAVYGTNLDQENLLTQNTSIPLGNSRQSVNAGSTMTTALTSMFGGQVFVSLDQSSNNKWNMWLEYYDYTSKAWTQFEAWHGSDKGQSYSAIIVLPYAPVRMNVKNDDTVAQFITWAVIAP